MMKNTIPVNYTLINGARHRATYAATVHGILGDKAPPVVSKGSSFYNVDRWTLRFFVGEMCKWAHTNPGCIPSRDNITEWCDAANTQYIKYREIVIAHTPDMLNMSTALALTGGAVHEALHTQYSLRASLDVDEMCALILPRWALVPNWAPLYKLIQDWSNIIEDIRIERNGRKDFPGTEEKLFHLQNFILDMEARGMADIRAHDEKKKKKDKDKPTQRSTIGIISAAFRDRGLEYQTEAQVEAWAGYVQENPEAVDFVMKGPLRPILDKTMALGADNAKGCLELALDAMVELVKASHTQDNEDESEAKDGQPGDGKIECPSCGAPGHKLVVRPVADGKGGKVKGKGLCTCTVCGWQQEVDIKKNSTRNALKDAAKEPGPKFEGFDPEDLDEGDGGGEGDESKGKEGQGKPSDKTGPTKTGGTKGATGHANGDGYAYGEQDDVGDHAGNDWTKVAEEALEGAKEGAGVLDNNAALAQAVQNVRHEEDRKLLTDEQVWRPFDPSIDVVNLVRPSRQGVEKDTAQAKFLLGSVMEECSYLRARLATIMRALEQTDTLHGVPLGEELSEQYFVDTALDLRAHTEPKRAFYMTEERIDLSMAVAVVVDQSSSMAGWLQEATKILMALTEPLDRLGIPVLCCGFRDGRMGNHSPENSLEAGHYHRFSGKVYDVFKLFDERFAAVIHRFANTRAEASTPMADGIQFGLNALMYRKEAHRVLFVITDGYETEASAVINWQLRVARDAGIHIIGVGLGPGASYVKTRFPDHVHDDKLSAIPKKIVQKLNDLVDVRALKRGRMIKTDAKIKDPWQA